MTFIVIKLNIGTFPLLKDEKIKIRGHHWNTVFNYWLRRVQVSPFKENPPKITSDKE